jgi:beta-phosphoglucomutase family hydrolase
MSEEKKYNAVIFDMDGVIVDNQKYHHDAWMQFCMKYGITVGGDISRYFGRTNTDILGSLFPENLNNQQLYEFSGEKEKLYQELYQGNIEAAEGLELLLGKLQEKGIKMAIATSAPEGNVDFVLGNTNLHMFFDVVINSNMIKKGKPDPEIYLKAAEELGEDPSNCIVVEDSVAGVQSGKAAGMCVVAITTTNPKANLHEADMIIDHFREFDMKKF